MRSERIDSGAGLVYQAIWYAMILTLALTILIQQFGVFDKASGIIEVLLQVYFALIPLGLLAISAVLFARKTLVTASVSLVLFIIWLLLRFI